SYNHGVEGPTRDEAVQAARRRAMRALLGTLVVSSGTPMLTAGDELGRTQHGNNNAYAFDDESVWVDWDLDAWQQDMLATTTALLALRRGQPALRPDRYTTFTLGRRDWSELIAWFDAEGESMSLEAWYDVEARVLQMFRRPPAPQGGMALVVINGTL